MSTPAASQQFKLGEQPEWAGTEACAPLTTQFIASLLQEDPVNSLVNRGYAVVELSGDAVANYSSFHSGMF